MGGAERGSSSAIWAVWAIQLSNSLRITSAICVAMRSALSLGILPEGILTGAAILIAQSVRVLLTPHYRADVRKALHWK